MKSFDLEKALAGEKVITRDGRPITQLVKFKTNSGSILYALDCDNDTVEPWLIDGRYHDVAGECGSDLFMAPKKLSGFVNIYDDRGSIQFTDRDIADSCAINRTACIGLSQFDEGHGL